MIIERNKSTLHEKVWVKRSWECNIAHCARKEREQEKEWKEKKKKKTKLNKDERFLHKFAPNIDKKLQIASNNARVSCIQMIACENLPLQKS